MFMDKRLDLLCTVDGMATIVKTNRKRLVLLLKVFQVWDAPVAVVALQPDVQLSCIHITKTGGGQWARDNALSVSVQDDVYEAHKVLRFLRLLPPQVVRAHMNPNSRDRQVMT